MEDVASQLPDDVVQEIFTHLSSQVAGMLLLASKQHNKFQADDSMWRQMARNSFLGAGSTSEDETYLAVEEALPCNKGSNEWPYQVPVGWFHKFANLSQRQVWPKLSIVANGVNVRFVLKIINTSAKAVTISQGQGFQLEECDLLTRGGSISLYPDVSHQQAYVGPLILSTADTKLFSVTLEPFETKIFETNCEYVINYRNLWEPTTAALPSTGIMAPNHHFGVAPGQTARFYAKIYKISPDLGPFDSDPTFISNIVSYTSPTIEEMSKLQSSQQQ